MCSIQLCPFFAKPVKYFGLIQLDLNNILSESSSMAGHVSASTVVIFWELHVGKMYM